VESGSRDRALLPGYDSSTNMVPGQLPESEREYVRFRQFRGAGGGEQAAGKKLARTLLAIFQAAALQ
jgi:hypothetical protein